MRSLLILDIKTSTVVFFKNSTNYVKFKIFYNFYSFVFSAFTDGAFYYLGYSTLSWYKFSDIKQIAFLSYSNGIQKTIIELEFTRFQQNKAFWIFPVSAKPDSINIMLLKRGEYDIVFNDLDEILKKLW